jgi:hypothetical protein
MKPLESIRKPIMLRVRRETALQIHQLAHCQGLRDGPFLAHVVESIALCPPEKFHAAMAEFLDESRRR